MDEDLSEPSPRYSDRFNAPDGDVTISSSDGVLFKVHRKDLETYSDIFPGTDVPVDDETVSLSEHSSTLELLFQYMRRQRQPDLSKVPPEELAELAEAAEKYCVYSAMEVCKVYMQAAILKIPLTVMGYAARHGYESLCAEAAPHTLEAKAADAQRQLDATCFTEWVLWREEWLQVMVKTHTSSLPSSSLFTHKGSYTECHVWYRFQASLLQDLGSSLAALQKPRATFDKQQWLLADCTYCAKRAENWRLAINTMVLGIPVFNPLACLA